MRIVLVLVVCLLVASSALGQAWGDKAVVQAERPKALCWSSLDVGPLFVTATQPKSKDALIYDGGDFSLRLTDTLSYDRTSDYFSFWLGVPVGEQFVYVKHSEAGYATSVRGIGSFVVSDLGKLKLLSVSSGERFLFTEVGGAWRCVSVVDRGGRQLLIDYNRNGVITQVRDGRRTLEPVYRSDRLASVYQIWPISAGRQLAMVALD